MSVNYVGMFSARIDRDLGVRCLKLITYKGIEKSEFIRDALSAYADEQEKNIKVNLDSLKEWEA